MAIGDLKLIGFLKTKMHWHQARQQLLAENVANADTPRYRARDLAPLRFEAPMAGLSRVAAARTDPGHVAMAMTGGSGGRFGAEDVGLERTATGNAVVLEEEMMKVSANQFDYQLASSLYAKSLGLIRAALGRNA